MYVRLLYSAMHATCRAATESVCRYETATAAHTAVSARRLWCVACTKFKMNTTWWKGLVRKHECFVFAGLQGTGAACCSSTAQSRLLTAM